MSFGQKLRYLRRKAHLLTYELADKSGFTPSMISRFQCDRSKPDDEGIERLAQALGVPKERLLV